jgi:phosphohistidine phosphatase
MTQRLILTRHAKSGWDDPTSDDHDRILTDRGRRSAVTIGQWLTGQNHTPDHVLVSSAARTQETWALVRSQLPNTIAADVDPILYLASAGGLMRALQGVKAGKTLLLIAHNPGISQLASTLLARQPASRQFQIYPTGATTVIDFDAETWGDTSVASGQFVDFVVPRDLE